jgi:hypothetical protein
LAAGPQKRGRLALGRPGMFVPRAAP